MPRSKKVYLTMQQRVDVLKDLETCSIGYAAQKYAVHPMTIRRIQENAVKIRNMAEKGIREKRQRTFKQPAYEELENQLSMWFAEERAMGHAISDTLILQKGRQLKEELGTCSNFKLSSGWLQKFKNRRHIRLIRIYGEKASADEHGANLFVSNFQKYIEEEDINYENIYNMDETELLWKSLPSRTLAGDNEKTVSGHKARKDRVTVGLCANATGTHQITPLVIHKYQKLRVLKDCMNQLPVIFKAETNARVNQTIFVDWFENHFKKAVRQHQLENGLCGKVILLVDNCSSHKFPSGYEHDDNFEVRFLPPNTTSLIQPMDQGVIEKMKRLFRRQLVQHLIARGYSIEDFFKQYTIKDCLHAISTSWKDLTCSDLRNAWKNIIPSMQTIEETEEPTIITEIQQVWSQISQHDVTVEEIENYFTACSEDELKLSRSLEERVAEEGVEERVAEEGDEENAAEEGVEERAAEEGVEERAAEEGVEERVAEEGDEENAAEEGVEERAAEEGVEERVAEEEGDHVVKLSPKLKKDFEDWFKQYDERLKKHLPLPLQYQLEGAKLAILGYKTSKKMERP